MSGLPLGADEHQERQDEYQEPYDEHEVRIPRAHDSADTIQTTASAERVLSEVKRYPPWEIDPINPHNWPQWKKVYHTVVPSLCALIPTLASSIITLGTKDIMKEFNVSEEVSKFPYVFYVLGLAFAPMIAAPASETIGRRGVYWTCFPMFALFTMGVGFGKTIYQLVILRFFAGLAGGAGLAIGSATIADVWTPALRGQPMVLYVASPFMGPAIGPVVGGFVTEKKGWRWTMWTALFFTVALLMPALPMSETYRKAIIEKRLKRDRRQWEKDTGEKFVPLPSGDRRRSSVEATKHYFALNLLRPLQMLFTEPIPGLFALYVAFNFALQYSFYDVFPDIFLKQYGFNLGEQGLVFLGIGVGVMIAVVCLFLNNKYIYNPRAARWREQQSTEKFPKPPPPEWRLFVAFPGSIIIPPGLFLFGWTAYHKVHWIVPIIGMAMFGVGQVFIFMSASLYILDFYGPLYGASAIAANNMLRYIFGFAFPLFATQMYRGLDIGWASSLLAFISVGLMPIPWCFYIWGPKLRRHSNFTHGD